MARFDRQVATALKLIAKNGESVTWRTIPDATPSDPDKPWRPGTTTPVDNPVIICFLPASEKTFSYMNASEVPKGAFMGLMGNVPFEPKLKDVAIRNGKQLRISAIDLLSPNGQKILYTVVFEE